MTKPILERYQRYLFHLRQTAGRNRGKPLSFRAQHSRLVPIRMYFKWLTRQNVLLSNPASELELPRLERRLPRHVLTADEAEAVLSEPNLHDPLGLRDRAILEVLYSTGIRRMELLNLSVFDVDEERGTLLVRQGKGKKDRMVPVGERALWWVRRYLDQVRPGLVVRPEPGELFLTAFGEPFSPRRMSQLVRSYVSAADIGKQGACHLFRHTMATLMLENGADIRHIQEMLGHAELSTTQLYTQVSIRRLKAMHSLVHPAEKDSRSESAEKGPARPLRKAGARSDSEPEPQSEPEPGSEPITEDALHRQLAAEVNAELAGS